MDSLIVLSAPQQTRHGGIHRAGVVVIGVYRDKITRWHRCGDGDLAGQVPTGDVAGVVQSAATEPAHRQIDPTHILAVAVLIDSIAANFFCAGVNGGIPIIAVQIVVDRWG